MRQCYVTSEYFLDIIREGTYTLTTMFLEDTKIGDIAQLIETGIRGRVSVNRTFDMVSAIEMVCLDIKPVGNGYISITYGLICGSVKI